MLLLLLYFVNVDIATDKVHPLFLSILLSVWQRESCIHPPLRGLLIKQTRHIEWSTSNVVIFLYSVSIGRHKYKSHQSSAANWELSFPASLTIFLYFEYFQTSFELRGVSFPHYHGRDCVSGCILILRGNHLHGPATYIMRNESGYFPFLPPSRQCPLTVSWSPS